jgi:hypothetical protein
MIRRDWAVLCAVRWHGRHFHVLALLGQDEDGPVVSLLPGSEMVWQMPPHQLDWPVRMDELLPMDHPDYRHRLDRLLDVDAAFPLLRPATPES